MSTKITAVSIAVQIDGKPYFVNLPEDRMMMAVQLIASLSDNGKLNVLPAPEGYRMVPIGELS